MAAWSTESTLDTIGIMHWSMWGFWQRLFAPHRGIWQPNANPLRGYVKKHFNPREFWPQFERIVAYCVAFFIYFLSIPTHSPRDFLKENSLSVCPSHVPVLVFVWKHMCLGYYTNPGAFWHKNLYTSKSRNAFMTRNFSPIWGLWQHIFSNVRIPCVCPRGGGVPGNSHWLVH